MELEQGEYRLEITHPGYDAISEVVKLDRETVERTFELVRASGVLLLENFDPQSNVFIDGTYMDISEGTIVMPTGIYNITVERDGYEKKSDRVTLMAGEKRRFNAALTRKTALRALLRSAVIPGAGQFYTGQSNKAALFSILFLGGLAASVVYDRSMEDAIGRYDDNRDSYLRSYSGGKITSYRTAMVRQYDKIESFEKSRNLSIVFTAVVWAAGVLDCLLLPPKYGVQKRITLNPDFTGCRVNVALD
jgi:hypothetical protein